MGVAPAVGSPGTSLRIEGVGFSLVAAENVVTVGGSSATASLYGVIENSGEFLTFDVPEEATAGDGILFVTVAGVSSNALPFTVTPP